VLLPLTIAHRRGAVVTAGGQLPCLVAVMRGLQPAPSEVWLLLLTAGPPWRPGVVAGEAGVGKTRLVTEFADRAPGVSRTARWASDRFDRPAASRLSVTAEASPPSGWWPSAITMRAEWQPRPR
jgi:hypothetical protein